MAFLNELYSEKMLTNQEYAALKNDLMIRHKIPGSYSTFGK